MTIIQENYSIIIKKIIKKKLFKKIIQENYSQTIIQEERYNNKQLFKKRCIQTNFNEVYSTVKDQQCNLP